MIRKMTKTVKEWNQKNSGVQVVVVRGAGETSEPVLVNGEGIVLIGDGIFVMTVSICVKHRQSFL